MEKFCILSSTSLGFYQTLEEMLATLRSNRVKSDGRHDIELLCMLFWMYEKKETKGFESGETSTRNIKFTIIHYSSGPT